MRLKNSEIKASLKDVPLWTRRGQTIHRTLQFEGFPDAIKFVRQVAVVAEKHNHHPDIDIRWNKVALALSTHSEGGLTAKDFLVAGRCDRLFSKF